MVYSRVSQNSMKCWEGEIKNQIINSASNIGTILYVREERMNGRVHQGERHRAESFAKFWFTEF